MTNAQSSDMTNSTRFNGQTPASSLHASNIRTSHSWYCQFLYHLNVPSIAFGSNQHLSTRRRQDALSSLDSAQSRNSYATRIERDAKASLWPFDQFVEHACTTTRQHHFSFTILILIRSGNCHKFDQSMIKERYPSF